MKALALGVILLQSIVCVKVALYSYNTAGIFRRLETSSDEFKAFHSKIVNDLIRDSSKGSEMFIFAYQEIWNACNIPAELLSSFLDNFRKSLKNVVLYETKLIMKMAFPKKKVTCQGEQNHSLMTVACRFYETWLAPGGEWFKPAFKYGWSEFGSPTTRMLFGFKGLLGTSIALQDNRQLLVINLHLSSKSLEDRRKGIITARELAQPYLSSGEFSLILVGDFNARSFSLVAPDPERHQLVEYTNNVGGAFLLMCLTNAIKTEDFKAEGHEGYDCSKVIAKAKEYDEISYIFKREFPLATEAKELKFNPTFCFEFEHDENSSHVAWTAPKKSESIPSFTDRIFFIPQKDASLTWSEYTSLPLPDAEPSDHQAIIGVFEISAERFSKNIFASSTFKEVEVKKEVLQIVSYRNLPKKDWVKRRSSEKKPRTFKIPGYKAFKKLDHNKMLEGITVSMYFDFLEAAKEIFLEVEPSKKSEEIPKVEAPEKSEEIPKVEAPEKNQNIIL